MADVLLQQLAPKLVGFESPYTMDCPACNADRVPHWWNRLRTAFGFRPISLMTVGYCPGSKPPVDEHQVLFQKVEIPNECLGLYEPHFHLTCNACGYKQFMKTKR